MDILLTHGYFLHEDPHELKVMKPYPPLGILYNAAYLKRAGFDVGVFDTTFSSLADFEAYILRERPSVVGLYTNLMTKFNVLKMMAVCKSVGATIILGGPEPVNYAEEYLTRGADVIVVGEGEATLAELLPRLAQVGAHRLDGVAGVIYRAEDGSIGRNLARSYVPDLDALPDPDREAIDLDRYVETWRTHHGAGSTSLICARGCPYHCEWCSHAVYGNTHRRRSPQRVAAEVDYLLARYKPDQLWYADDVFTIKHSWLFEYADELKRRNLRVPFECISRADRLNEQVIDRLAEMGCQRLWIGSESGSQNVLDLMKREVSVAQVQAMTHALKRRGIQTGMFIMLGYDGEDERDLAATVDHLKKAAPDVFLTTVAYPIKGTPYYAKVTDRVLARTDWATRSDRDLSVTGRHSPRYYSFATRWMVNAVALHREQTTGGRITRQIKAAANAVIGRAGMALTKHERDE
ncbi:MAG: B12-binding domain-containing radical SAM protein [Thermoflexales bacterium]|nr:B12-binding domain-containing radical SAM protein [Thermoflexales bacterium]